MHEFNKINVIKELLQHVKYNFAAVLDPVLDLADIVFTIEALCIE